jgi:t-SNARE complex subunit (syntaxin)
MVTAAAFRGFVHRDICAVDEVFRILTVLRVHADSQSLAKRVKEYENLHLQKEVQNRREEVMAAFEDFDQKTMQLFNFLDTVLKNQDEMQNGIQRNVL